MKRTLVTLALVLAGAGGAHAEWYGQPSYNDIDARQHRQIERIQRGVRDGSITRHEAANLIAEQRRIAHIERHARADGRIDPVERYRLQALQDRASQHIRDERHDREVAYRPWYRRWY